MKENRKEIKKKKMILNDGKIKEEYKKWLQKG
jgi:hypothetical protein